MFENIALSFQGIWNHKTRSFLTMLGIIIGIAAIITIVSTIKGTNDQIKQNLIGSGNNLVTVSLGSTTGDYLDYEYGDLPTGVDQIDEETLESVAEIDGVVEASAYLSRDYSENVYYRNDSFTGAMRGVDSHYFSVCDYALDYGRNFIESDFTNRRKVVILDTNAAKMFEGEDPIGETIEIKGIPFTVIGVVEDTSKSTVTISSFSDYVNYADSSSGTIFIPNSVWSTVFRYDEPENLVLRAESTDDMNDAGTAAADVLNSAVITNTDYEYAASNVLEQASELQALSNSTNQQLIWIAGISLLVGGIGVMNIMLVSVSERTREIGLKKAIGAKKGRILGQFLTEAGVLTSLGGVLGVACGIGLAKLLSNVIGTPASISVPACVIAVAFSMMIGVIFGLVPAVKAAKLNPIDALRRD